MNIFKITAASILLMAAMPVTAATTVNFDQLPNGTTLPNSGTTISTQYQSVGVTFLGLNTLTGATGALNSWGIIPASGPGGSGNYLGNFGDIPPGGVNNYLLAPRYNVVSLFFNDTTSGVSFGLSSSRPGVTINAYSATGITLQSLIGVESSSGFTVQTLSAANIARVDIIGTIGSFPNSAAMFGIDNLTFTPNAVTAGVPETATWAMMTLGFGAMGFAMRRKKISTRIRFA